jgi:hypothetical protein
MQARQWLSGILALSLLVSRRPIASQGTREVMAPPGGWPNRRSIPKV